MIALIAGFASCSEEDSPVNPDNPDEIVNGAYYGHKNVIVEESDGIIVNYGDIVVGLNEADDIVFDQVRTVMSGPKGRHKEHCLNVCGIGAFSLTYYGDTLSIDEDTKVKGVTMINRGTITIHTKRLVEKYVDQLKVDDNDEAHDYQYFVFTAMYGLMNDTFINEGKIEIIFDHDPTIVPKVYGIAFSTAKGGNVVNNGTIIFRGVGGISTRMRGCASFANSINFVNRGTISMDVEQADDSRVVTRGGDSINVTNEGTINVSLPGTVFVLTRYGTGNYVNNGDINVTYKSNLQQYWSDMGNSMGVMYEPIKPNHVNQPPFVNRGNINITMDETAPANPKRRCYGMWFDLSLGAAEDIAKTNFSIINTGSITLNQSANDYLMAEAAFTCQPTMKDKGGVNISVANWKTTLRDYTEKPLFVACGANVDMSISRLIMSPSENYVWGTPYSVAAEDIIKNIDTTGEYLYSVSNIDMMKVESEDDNYVVDFDKTNMTVSMTEK